MEKSKKKIKEKSRKFNGEKNFHGRNTKEWKQCRNSSVSCPATHCANHASSSNQNDEIVKQVFHKLSNKYYTNQIKMMKLCYANITMAREGVEHRNSRKVISHICHRYHKSITWRNLSTWQIITWKKIIHMRNVKKICNVEKLLTQCMVFCPILPCFVDFFAIYAVLSQNPFYTHLHGEKLSNKLCPWRKNSE